MMDHQQLSFVIADLTRELHRVEACIAALESLQAMEAGNGKHSARELARAWNVLRETRA